MKITITEAAENKLSEKIEGNAKFLKLKYETDGCGCVVSGVTELWMVNNLDEDDQKVETTGRPVYVEKSKEVFLDEQLIIDFSPVANCFQLESPNQFLNPRMSLYDKTKGN